MNDPAIILADEPVASLDPKIGADIIHLLANQAREREATMICSLHQVDFAKAVADRIVGLHGGEVVFDDVPEALGQAAFAAIYHGDDARLHSAVR
jgi:phosphonate transport system ATP-binding protein